jgi:hypothetical protein
MRIGSTVLRTLLAGAAGRDTAISGFVEWLSGAMLSELLLVGAPQLTVLQSRVLTWTNARSLELVQPIGVDSC